MEQYFGLIDARVSASDKELPVRRVSIIGRKILYLDNLPSFFKFMNFVRLQKNQFWMCNVYAFCICVMTTQIWAYFQEMLSELSNRISMKWVISTDIVELPKIWINLPLQPTYLGLVLADA